MFTEKGGKVLTFQKYKEKIFSLKASNTSGQLKIRFFFRIQRLGGNTYKNIKDSCHL